MTSLSFPSTITASDWRMILIIARREVRDTLRDWRLVFPILGLTLFFPGLMTFVAQRMSIFLSNYSDTELLGTRSIPLLLMVVGFFPTSFSLVIALESFVGEKERKSLEPLLSTPLTNTQLYLGKMLAAVLPPVLASYIGIIVYSVGVFLIGEPINWQSFALVVVLTTVQAVLMVAASVIVSSQTTSVRAANMLASFIIVPIALLLQVEAVMLAFENYVSLLWMIVAVMVTTFIFIRLGIQLFDREQLLGRNIDFLRVEWAWHFFWQRFTSRHEDGSYPSVRGWYRQLWSLLPNLRQPIALLLIILFFSWGLGYGLAQQYPLPEEMLSQFQNTQTGENFAVMQEMLGQLPFFIFTHNLRVMLLVGVVGTLSFGVGSAVIFMLPWIVISFITAQFAAVGENPLLFVATTVLPHGWVELPVLLLVIGAALRWQITLIAPPKDGTIIEKWLAAGADFGRILVGWGVPLFLLAALLESFLTPAVVAWVYG